MFVADPQPYKDDVVGVQDIKVAPIGLLINLDIGSWNEDERILWVSEVL